MNNNAVAPSWCDPNHPEWYEFHPDVMALKEETHMKKETVSKDKCTAGKIHLLVPHPDVDGIAYGQCVRCGYLVKTGHEPTPRERETQYKNYAARFETCCDSATEYLHISEDDLAAYNHLATVFKEAGHNIHLEVRPVMAGLVGVLHSEGSAHCDQCREHIDPGTHKFFKPTPQTKPDGYLCLWCATTIPSPGDAARWLASQGDAHNIDAYNHYLHIRQGQALVCACDYEGQQ